MFPRHFYAIFDKKQKNSCIFLRVVVYCNKYVKGIAGTRTVIQMKNKINIGQILKFLKLLGIEALRFIRSKTGLLVCGIILAGLIISLLIGALFSSNKTDETSEITTESETVITSECLTSELITESPDYTPEVPEITDSESETDSEAVTEKRLTLADMEIPDTSWAYFMINRSNPVPDGYINNIEFKSVYSNYSNFYLDARVADFAKCMINDAENDGVILLICSAYRSHERQTANFDNRVKSYASAKYSFTSAYALTAGYIAIPGTSEHETGLAIDFITPGYTSLDSGFERTSAYKWLAENSYKYGFILRYPSGTSELTGINYEPWHFRFIGFEHAQKIYESGLCLEEYMEKDRETNPDLSFNTLEALKIPAQPAWYEYYLNPPADTESESETDSAESDSTETESDSDSTESDSIETDSDSSESDSTETNSDLTESENVDIESESDTSESYSADTESAIDTSETDSTDTESDTESDTYEDITEESDTIASDDSEIAEETEAEIESDTEFVYKPITLEDLGISTKESENDSGDTTESADTVQPDNTDTDTTENIDSEMIEETDEII